MTEPLFAAELNAIRAREQAATPGPWTWEDDPATLYAGREPDKHGLNLLGRMEPDWNGKANLDFIAHARTDVPRLLAEIERLRTDIAARETWANLVIEQTYHKDRRIADLESQLAAARERATELYKEGYREGEAEGAVDGIAAMKRRAIEKVREHPLLTAGPASMLALIQEMEAM